MTQKEEKGLILAGCGDATDSTSSVLQDFPDIRLEACE